MKRYCVDKPDTTYAQIRFMKKNEAEKFQQLVVGNYELDELLSLLDGNNSVSERVLLNQSFFRFFNKSIFE